MTITNRVGGKGLAGMLVAFLIAIAGLTLVNTAPASAAYPTCNTYDARNRGGVTILVPAYGTTVNCVLYKGAPRNAGTKVLQRALVKCYNISVGPDGIDGYYGQDTKDAVSTLQRRLGGLVVDGEYGPQTRQKMMFSNSTGSACRSFDI